MKVCPECVNVFLQSHTIMELVDELPEIMLSGSFLDTRMCPEHKKKNHQKAFKRAYDRLKPTWDEVMNTKLEPSYPSQSKEEGEIVEIKETKKKDIKLLN